MSCVASWPGTEVACSLPASWTATALRSAILERLGRRVRGLEVVMAPAGVILRGQATSYYVKQLAQQALLAVYPGPLLANEIKVSPARASAATGAGLV